MQQIIEALSILEKLANSTKNKQKIIRLTLLRKML